MICKETQLTETYLIQQNLSEVGAELLQSLQATSEHLQLKIFICIYM